MGHTVAECRKCNRNELINKRNNRRGSYNSRSDFGRGDSRGQVNFRGKYYSNQEANNNPYWGNNHKQTNKEHPKGFLSNLISLNYDMWDKKVN